MRLIVAARKSKLSRVQVIEVQKELNQYHPNLTFEHLLIDTTGDIDQKTSLRGLDKSNFFTKEVDEALLKLHCNLAIHSAKDLPEPLDSLLAIAAITKGLDNSDCLVMKEGMTLDALKSGAIIATSSERREECVKKLRSDLTFVDLRGTIEQRLSLLQSGKADGVVVAEAAIQRLQLTHLNRIKLPGPTAPMQGQLAIVTRKDAHALIKLFSCLDSR